MPLEERHNYDMEQFQDRLDGETVYLRHGGYVSAEKRANRLPGSRQQHVERAVAYVAARNPRCERLLRKYELEISGWSCLEQERSARASFETRSGVAQPVRPGPSPTAVTLPPIRAGVALV